VGGYARDSKECRPMTLLREECAYKRERVWAATDGLLLAPRIGLISPLLGIQLDYWSERGIGVMVFFYEFQVSSTKTSTSHQPESMT
jgi:hypothetical protein